MKSRISLRLLWIATVSILDASSSDASPLLRRTLSESEEEEATTLNPYNNSTGACVPTNVCEELSTTDCTQGLVAVCHVRSTRGGQSISQRTLCVNPLVLCDFYMKNMYNKDVYGLEEKEYECGPCTNND